MAAILVVDDEPVERSLLATILRGGGHAVVEAPDGRQGLRALERDRFDLILCDLFMPETDGLELIREVRRRQLSIKVIVISGGSSDGRLDMLAVAERLGAAVICKPFRVPGLRSQVETVLNSKGALLATSAEEEPDAGSRAAGR
jgi:CheY-like chemotaxis protein